MAEDKWGVLVEGPLVQTFSSEVAARNWQQNMAAFWGVIPELVTKTDAGWMLAHN